MKCPKCGARIHASFASLEHLRERSLQHLERQEWDEALEAAETWYKFVHISIDAERFLDHVQALAERGRREPGRRPDAAMTQERLALIRNLAGQAEASENWLETARHLDGILAISGPDPEILERRNTARQKQRKLLEPKFAQARDALARDDLKTASAIYEDLNKLLPWDVDLLHEWERVRDLRISRSSTRSRKGTWRRRILYAAAAVPVVVLLLITSPLLRVTDAVDESAGERPVRELTQEQAAAAGLVLLGREWSDPGRGGERRTLLIAGEPFAFRWIPPGKSIVGSPQDDPSRDEDETQWEARFSQGFWMAETEVTESQWHTVMEVEDMDRVVCASCPVGGINWFKANAFAARLNSRIHGGEFRLPYEAEWEYAARAGATGPFAHECAEYPRQTCRETDPACLDRFAWSLGNTENSGIQPVAGKAPNAWGLHDMHGNASEWCLDWYAPYPGGARTDYRGSDRGVRRVQRGGGLQESRFLRSANRSAAVPSFGGGIDSGFRIVLTVNPPHSPS
jgi:formylglycine-generating enzyme required for sulfatase activity